MIFKGFDTWKEVLAFAKECKPGQLFYHAPLNIEPVALLKYEVRARTIRIWPPGSTGRGRMRTSDPFTADVNHFDRFRREDVG